MVDLRPTGAQRRPARGCGFAASRLREAQRRGWAEADLEWIEDAGFSAKSLKRPGMTLALEALRSREATTLVVSKMDRLSRSLLDFAGIMQKAQKEGWTLLALDSPADLSTPTGEVMAGVLAVFAQLERRMIGQRTADALAAKRAEGVVLGRPRSLPTNVEARILTEHAAGASLSAISRGLNADAIPTAQGGASWYPTTVRNVVISRAPAAALAARRKVKASPPFGREGAQKGGKQALASRLTPRGQRMP